MSSAERLERRLADNVAGLSRAAVIDAALFVALAGSIAVVTSLYGAYDIDVWAPAGLLLLCLATVLLALGRRPPPGIAVAAGLLIALGAWSLASTAWGGLPQQAWLKFDQSVLAAAALVAGSSLTSKPGRRGLVVSAVLAGISLHAVIVFVRLAADAHPEEWVHRRFVQGPVGYHNAQGLLFALAIPLALWAAGRQRATARALGGASAGLLAAGLLLTQSRGALLGAAVGVLVQLVWARRASLLLLVIALAAAMAGLFLALREVDDALLTGTPAEVLTELRTYVLAAAVAALVLGAAAALAGARVVGRSVVVALVVLLLGTGAVVAVHERSALLTAEFALPGLPADENVTTPAGATRLPTLAPNGRADAWRVARSMAAQDPLVGSGQGQFARRWTEERSLPNLYILQPHNIELELLSELGAIGLGLFAGFVAALGYALTKTSRRSVAAAAMGAGTVVVVGASLDWTWSFPGIVLPALLVVGAAAGSRMPRAPGRLATAGIVAATLAVGAAIALPYVADRYVERARAALGTGDGAASSNLESARMLDPWNAEALSLEGVIAEREGNYALAVDRFREAAANTDRPWIEHYNEARVLASAGDHAGARAACERAVAANPAERSLYGGPCAYEQAGNAWPVIETDEATVPLGLEIAGLYVDKGCAGCAVHFSDTELIATTLGQPDSRDTAYAVLEVDASPSKPVVLVRDVLRLPAQQEVESHVAVLQVLDARDRLIYELYVSGRDRTIAFYSPPGGLRANDVNQSTNVVLEPAGRSRTVEIESRSDGISIRIDGVERLRLDSRAGAETSAPAFVRVGIIGRLGWSPNAPLRFGHEGFAATAAKASAR